MSRRLCTACDLSDAEASTRHESGRPDVWETAPAWVPPRYCEPCTSKSQTALLERLFTTRPVRGTLPECGEQSSEGGNSPDDERAPERRQGSLAPRVITKAVFQQLTAMGFADLLEGAADIPIESNAFHLEWRGSKKNLSTSEIQRLNGIASAAGDDVPKRLILITGGGLTRPAAAFAGKAKAYAFCLDSATGRMTALNSFAREALLPTDTPGTGKLEPW